MSVVGDFLDGKRVVLFATQLPLDKQASSVDGNAALQIRRAECRLAIAPVCGPNQLKQSGVLRNRHKLAVTEGPTLGRKITTEHSNFSDKRTRHSSFSFRVKPSRLTAIIVHNDPVPSPVADHDERMEAGIGSRWNQRIATLNRHGNARALQRC